MSNTVTFSYCFKSAGPAKESKAEKRKKEKKGAKGWGGGGVNRPVSGKPGKKDVQTNKDQFENLSKQNNLSAEQGRIQLGQENNVQATEDIDKNESNEANFADQNSSGCRETGVNENNKENLVIDNETTNKEKANLFDKSTEVASISRQVNIEENSVGAVYNEGIVTAL